MNRMKKMFPHNSAGNTRKRLANFYGLFLGLFIFVISFASASPVGAVPEGSGAPIASSSFSGYSINRNWVLDTANSFLITFDYGEPMDNTSLILTASNESLWNVVEQNQYSWQDNDNLTGIINFTFPAKNGGAESNTEAYNITLNLSGGLSNGTLIEQIPYDVSGVINVDVAGPRVTLLSAVFSVGGETSYETSDNNFTLNSVETDNLLTGLSFSVNDGALNTETISDAVILLPGQSETTAFAGNFVYGDDGKFTWQTEAPFTLTAGTSTIYVVFQDQYENYTTATVMVYAAEPYTPPSDSGGSAGGWGGVEYVPPIIPPEIIPVVTTTDNAQTMATDTVSLITSSADGTATDTVRIVPTTTPFQGVLGENIDILDTLIAQTKYGERSALVGELQYELRLRSFFPVWHRITGYYGLITKAAVEKYLASR